MGIISSVGPSATSDNPWVIRIDMAVNSGDSGGPPLAWHDHVFGVTVQNEALDVNQGSVRFAFPVGMSGSV